MGAPKENKGSKTTHLSKAHLHPFTNSPIPLFPNDPYQSKKACDFF